MRERPIVTMDFPFELVRERELEVLGFGTNAVDYLIRVPEYPAFNSKIRLENYTQAAGGEIASTMAGLSRLGIRTAYIGRFGDDPAGAIGIESLRADGVDLRFAETVAGASTQIAFIIIDAASGERTVIWDRDPKLSYSVDETPLHAAESAAILHLTPHDTQACIALAKMARDAGTLVSSDIDRHFDGLEDLMPLVDVLLVSEGFLESYTNIDNGGDALKQLRDRFGCRVVGVTLGELGSLVLVNDTFVRSPGFAVPGGCLDTTGAGDAFRVGFLYGVIRGRTVEETCRSANATAALKCRAVGARTALPDAKTLEDFLASDELRGPAPKS